MAQLLIRNLPDEVKERLKRRAKAHGRSVEAEARGILEAAAASAVEEEGFGTRLARKIASIGVTKEDVDELERAIEENRAVQRSRAARNIDFGD